MPKLRLTDTKCKSLPVPAKRHQIHYDTEVMGLGLCVTAKGARSFVVRYRRKADQVERNMVIGQFPTWTVTQARQRAKELRCAVDLGADPLGETEALRAEPTLAEVVERDWAEIKDKRRASTLKTWRRQLDLDILPRLGKRKLRTITEDDIGDLHAAISGRGSRVAANRTIMNLSGILTRAKVMPNPVHVFVSGKGKNRENARERYLSPAETTRLLAALDGEVDRQAVNAVRLIWLTGSRAGETLRAQWQDFDLGEGRWKKPRASTKGDQDHGIPLSAAALALLRAMHQSRDPKSRYLFPALDRDGRETWRQRLDRPWERVRRAANIADLHLHDLRHHFGTAVHDAGAPLAVVGKLLGHRDLRSTARYAHATEHGMRNAVERAGEAITGKVGSK